MGLNHSAAAAAVAAATQAATVQLTHFSMDLDVTQRNVSTQSTASSSSMAAMPSSRIGANLNALEATTSSSSSSNTAAKLIGNSNSSSAGEVLTYPTVHFSDPSRRFAQLATDIFTKHSPTDTSK